MEITQVMKRRRLGRGVGVMAARGDVSVVGGVEGMRGRYSSGQRRG